MKTPRIRYQLSAGGLPLNIFSLQLTSDGTLFYVARAGRNHGFTSESEIVEKGVSVHFGTRSPQFSTIKSHYRHAELEKELTSVALTSAVKQNGTFAWVGSTLCEFMPSLHYMAEPADQPGVIFGELTSSNGQIFYSVFVGHKDTAFGADEACEHAEATKFEIVLGAFRVVVLWRMLLMPPTRLGHAMRPKTFDPAALDAEGKSKMEKLMQGDAPATCAANSYMWSAVAAYKVADAVVSGVVGQNALVLHDMSIAKEIFEHLRHDAYEMLQECNALHYIGEVPHPLSEWFPDQS